MARGATATAGTKEDTAATAATAARAAALAATTATTVTVTEGVETWVMEAGTTVEAATEAGPRAAPTATAGVAMEAAAATAAATEGEAAAVAAGGGRPGGALTPTRDGTSIRTYLYKFANNNWLGSGGDPDPENKRKFLLNLGYSTQLL
jgi:hypothetical protein